MKDEKGFIFIFHLYKERETRLELATSALEGLHSTTELLPRARQIEMLQSMTIRAKDTTLGGFAQNRFDRITSLSHITDIEFFLCRIGVMKL